MTTILLGAAVLLGSATPFIFPLAFAMIMEIRFIPKEERNTYEYFGQRYTEYRKRVRRWL